jgi:hypothetical protein
MPFLSNSTSCDVGFSFLCWSDITHCGPAIFKLQKLDLKQQFKSFAFGLVREYPLTFCKYRNIEQYQYMNEPDLLVQNV